MSWLNNTETPFSGGSLNASGVNKGALKLILYLHFHQLMNLSGTTSDGSAQLLSNALR